MTKTHSVQVFRMGRPRFFQALLGNLRRSLRRSDEYGADFNVARRESAGAKTQVTPAERARIEALVRELARLGVAAEGPRDLARWLPFALPHTSRPPAMVAAS